MKKNKSFNKKVEKLSGNEQEGLVIAHFGSTAEVEQGDGQIIRCHLRKNAEPIACGDRVLWNPDQNNSGIVVAPLTRKSWLGRTENHGKFKLFAANVDIMLIVAAPQPSLSEHLIDRYLITAEKLNLTPILLLNKIDLFNGTIETQVDARLAVYKKIGYRIIYTSLLQPDTLTELQSALQNNTCILVGPSGVGKSSLINALTSSLIRTGETAASGLGKHTTTITRLYHLPDGGDLIDSPGVREFSLGKLDQEDIVKGFIEFKPFFNACRYRNCSHIKETDCAVQAAIANEEISELRFKSYLDLIKDTE